jgi:hypothetical protein
VQLKQKTKIGDRALSEVQRRRDYFAWETPLEKMAWANDLRFRLRSLDTLQERARTQRWINRSILENLLYNR